MANREKFIFDVDADIQGAVSNLGKVQKLMDSIERIRSKGEDNYTTTSQKDMDKAMRSMRELTNYKNKLDKDLRDIQRMYEQTADGMKIPKGATDEQIAQIRKVKEESQAQAQAMIKQQRDLEKEYNKSLAKIKELSTFQQNYSKNFKNIFASNDLYNLPTDDFDKARRILDSLASSTDDVSVRLSGVISKISEVNKLDRRSESASRRGAASKYMSHQQAKNFQQDYVTASHDYVKEKEDNLQALTRIGQERTRKHDLVKSIEAMPQGEVKQEDIDRKILAQQTIEALDKEFEERMELNRVLERTIANMKKYNQQIQGIEVKPERGTMRGMMYERAPAIGLALTGAVGLSVGGLYQKGDSINEAMRGDVISMGQRTDSTDWRHSIRDNAFEQGLADRMGFTGQEMLAFQNNYLSNAGYSGMDDLNSAANAQAEFARVAGLDTQSTSEFFDAAFSTGAVNGSQTKDLQDAFIGAIKNSGMEGREKDQIKALEGILGSVKSGRSMTNDEVMNVMGLQSTLAQSGNRSLSGASGGELLQGLNDGIRGGFNNPMVRLAFGQGTEYQGLEGRFALRERMDAGISDIRNVTDIAKMAENYMPNSTDGQNEVFASFVQNGLGTNITAEQAEGLMDLYRNDLLTEDSIKKLLNEDKNVGQMTAEKRKAEYQDSHEATANQSKAVTDKQAANINDLGDPIREANAALGAMPAPIYGAIVAIAALGVAAATTAASFGLSALGRGALGGKFGGKGKGGFFGKGKGKGGGPGGGGTSPILGPDGKPLPSSGGPAGGAATSRWDKAKGKVGSWMGGGSSAAEAAGGMKGAGGGGFWKGAGGVVKGAGGMLSKAVLPLSLLFGAKSIADAPKGTKGEATGSVAGGIGGGLLGGAAAGAALGSFFPVVGTAIGGILGGVLGSIGGSKAGGWLGGTFDPKVAKAGDLPEGVDPFGRPLDPDNPDGDFNKPTKPPTVEEPKNTSTAGAAMEESAKIDGKAEKQLDRENANRKGSVEDKRTKNIADESANLTRYDQLLDKAQQVIFSARSQGGIFGGESTDNSFAAQALRGDKDSDKIWNFFADKGFTPEAISGVMGNLQQESGLSTTAKNPTSGAYGLGQWLGGRKTNLTSFAKGKGMDPNSLDAQLEFLWHELNGGDSTTKAVLDKNGGLDALKNSKSVSGATNLFEKAFERSGGDAMDKRRGYANGFYNQYSGAQWASGAGRASTTANSANNMRVNSTITVNVKGDETVEGKVKNNKAMQQVASRIQSMIYGSMDYHSKEMRLT